MGERLAGGNVGIALLANTLATGAWSDALAYVAMQIVGAICGAMVAHAMFGEPMLAFSVHQRSGARQMFSEFVATFGLMAVIWGCSRTRSHLVPFAVGSYITAAYWFTASTSFANPAVTVARAMSNTFTGIRPADTSGFIVAQLAGAACATLLFHWLVPALPAAAARVMERN